MGSLGFTLADRLGAKSIPCSVSGCTRSWIQMSGKNSKLGGRAAGDQSDPGSTMCDPCREKFATLADIERACDREGCTGTWTWPVKAQLESFATRRPPQPHLCAADEAKLGALSDRQIPCSVEGCKRSWVLTRRAQLIAGAPDVEVTPPPAMCGPCANVYDKISDRPVTCGIRGCKKKWTWARDEQIKDYAAGESNQPPRRLCDSCRTVFGAIANREVRCRTSGCKHTWTWPREAQLDAAIADKPLPKAPHRMCQRCIDLYSGLKDVERPCRRAGCKRTWTDKRGAQLARAVRGKTGDPYPHYCTECEKEMGELEERQVPCKTEHCPGTWTWTAAQQLAAGVRPTPKVESAGADAPAADGGAGDQAQHGDQESAASNGHGAAATGPANEGAPAAAGAAGGDRKKRRRKRRHEVRPPERRCDDCLAFLTDRKTKEIPCTGCQTPIHWPPESQLQTHLGNWAEPSLCGACKRDLTEAARAAEREALRHGGHLAVPGTASDTTAEPTVGDGPADSGAVSVSAEDGAPPSEAPSGDSHTAST